VSATGRLLRADAVRAVRGALADGPPAWLVGGVVRDALLGRPLRDVDVAVAGDPAAAARAVASAVGGPVFRLSREFGAWRAIDRARGFVCDVAPLQGDSIEVDLARRDFTVNAMAVSVAGGHALDPHGGADDLAAGILRVLGPQAYEDDPLRTLRLVRLAAELRLAPDERTERLTAAAAARLGEPSPERVFVELRRLVVAPGVLAALELAARLGVLAAVLPELEALRGIEQSRFHHLDVYEHTIDVLRQLIELESDLERVFGDLAEPVAHELERPLADELTRGQALRFGALFHDLAKPGTRGVRPDGRVTFVGHDWVGEGIARDVLRRLSASERLRSYVGKLTREHPALGFLVHERPLDPRAVHAYLRRSEPVEVEVTVLSCADRMATRGAYQQSRIDAHLVLAPELIGAALEWRKTGPPRLPVRGDELAAELGIVPGRELGELLGRLEEAVYAGEVATREEAVSFARRVWLGDRG
jgi:poly(A) polymerase